MGKPWPFKGDCQSEALVLLHGMESWLSDFWSHLHTAEGLKQTIQFGGIGLMCLIIFAETGLLAGFFLPGDSLLVTAGVLSVANGDRPAYFGPWELAGALTLASIIGDQTGYWLGRKYGKTMETKPDSWWYKRKHLDAARGYFAEKGPLAPARFLRWNILGGILWINSLIWLGHKLGGTPLADQLHKVILIVIVVSFIPVLWTAAKRLLTSSSAPRT